MYSFSKYVKVIHLLNNRFNTVQSLLTSKLILEASIILQHYLKHLQLPRDDATIQLSGVYTTFDKGNLYFTEDILNAKAFIRLI